MTTRTLNRIIKAHTKTLHRQERIHDRFWKLNVGKASEEAVVKADCLLERRTRDLEACLLASGGK